MPAHWPSGSSAVCGSARGCAPICGWRRCRGCLVGGGGGVEVRAGGGGSGGVVRGSGRRKGGSWISWKRRTPRWSWASRRGVCDAAMEGLTLLVLTEEEPKPRRQSCGPPASPGRMLRLRLTGWRKHGSSMAPGRTRRHCHHIRQSHHRPSLVPAEGMMMRTRWRPRSEGREAACPGN